ncbi:uncharacterized protein LOC143819952 [Paroedura picta]|uniref:uncharacterized protein LOC143819952 n=1 Tax=Paroedura picta TaxID=143630 RepID=UPI004055CBBA
MKAPLLCLYLFGVVWAQSGLQPHHKKAKQKCTGEHQITVKSRNAKHGYYIFQYMYSPLMPSNQTWIKKEEDDNKSSYSGQHGPDKDKGPRQPSDNHTAEEKEEGHENTAEMGNESEPEGRRTSESSWALNKHSENPSNTNVHQHSSNPSNGDIPQHHSQYILDKGGNVTLTDDIGDIDGSGDMGFLGQDERHHGSISGTEHQTQGRDHQGPGGTEANSRWGRNEVEQSGISNVTKPSKGAYTKTGAKENEASLIQETNLHSHIPKKSKDSENKDYFNVSVKVKNATNKEPGKVEVGPIDSLDKDKEGNASTRLQIDFNVQRKISGDLLKYVDHMRKGRNDTSFSDTGEIIARNEIMINYTRDPKKGRGQTIVPDQKQDGQKIMDGETKPHPKGEERDKVIRSKQVNVADAMKTHKNDMVKEDNITGKSSSHIDVAGVSQKHRTSEEEHITGRSTSQVENPVFIQAGQTTQSRILSSGKLNGSGVTKSNTKSGGALFGGTSLSQRSGSGSINQSQKGTSVVGIIHGKSDNGVEGFHFTKPHQNKTDRHEIINRNAHRSDPERQEKGNRRLGVTFQGGNKEVVKGSIGYHKAPETADLGVDTSRRKDENSGHKSVGIKSPLTLAYGSHDYKHIARSREHSSLKNDRKLTEPSTKSSSIHNGRHGSSRAKQYHGHLGVLQRKSRRHEKRGKSRKNAHASDSSQSSESEENGRYESHQSYEDYQNDNPGSYQSSESVEENLSDGSNQRGDHSQMEDIYSREDSQEHRRN